ncbi:MAG TPA: hypothetical protein VMV59_08390 [Candidatus Dormibacteraeota bacterium]|nr:hypothetical protein [Candidatus Dormibacteraeota bacterium]
MSVKPETVERSPARALLDELRKAGVRLSVDSGGSLSARVDSASNFPPEIRQRIAEHEGALKAALLAEKKREDGEKR